VLSMFLRSPKTCLKAKSSSGETKVSFFIDVSLVHDFPGASKDARQRTFKTMKILHPYMA